VSWNPGSLPSTRWFKYDRDYLCLNKSQFVPVIFEPPCIKYDMDCGGNCEQNFKDGHVIVTDLSTVDARVLSQATLCDGRSGTGTSCSLSPSGLP
jgi:hypothetical protein